MCDRLGCRLDVGCDSSADTNGICLLIVTDERKRLEGEGTVKDNWGEEGQGAGGGAGMGRVPRLVSLILYDDESPRGY